MDTLPRTDEQILDVLRNIELNTAQQSSTPQNVDAIQPLSFPLTACSPWVDGASPETFISLLNFPKYSFDIPAECPYVFVPELARCIAFYRNNEPVPFAYVPANSVRTFKIPHLERLTVEVYPATATGFATIYVSSRPFEVEPSNPPSIWYKGIARQNVVNTAGLDTYGCLQTGFDIQHSLAMTLRVYNNVGLTQVDVAILSVIEELARNGEGDTALVLFGSQAITAANFNVGVASSTGLGPRLWVPRIRTTGGLPTDNADLAFWYSYN